MTKIKVKYLDKSVCRLTQYGNWIDLRASQTMELCPMRVDKRIVRHCGSVKVPLGVCIKLPKYYEAIIAPRSSTFGVFGILQTNSIGVVDETYCGDKDEWKLPILSIEQTTIVAGDRIAQFRIQLSQDAPWWARIKWLFSGAIKIQEVEHLDKKNRGGFGSTGNK